MTLNRNIKILLTGGSGFVGRNIIEQLGPKYTISAPSQEELDLLDDQAISRFIKSQKFNVIIHAANIGKYKEGEKPNEVSANNIRMFFNIVKHLEPNQKMIFMGSGAEYDKSRDISLAKEDDFDDHIPPDSYGFAKSVCSKYIEKSSNIVNLRCFGLYGKYEQPSRFISNAIIKALSNKPITVNKNVYFDYLYIDDLVKVIDYFILHKPRHHFYNVASGAKIDLVSLAKLIQSILKNKKGIIVKETGWGKEYTANVSRLKKETSMSTTSLKEGIKKLAEYYTSSLGLN